MAFPKTSLREGRERRKMKAEGSPGRALSPGPPLSRRSDILSAAGRKAACGCMHVRVHSCRGVGGEAALSLLY